MHYSYQVRVLPLELSWLKHKPHALALCCEIWPLEQYLRWYAHGATFLKPVILNLTENGSACFSLPPPSRRPTYCIITVLPCSQPEIHCPLCITLPANDWRTNESIAITPFGPINRTILCCDFFIRQDLQEGASYFKRVLWDTDVNKRIVISVELNLH